MRSVEIDYREGHHCVLVGGKEWSRHDSLKKAEEARDQIFVAQIQHAKKSSGSAGRDFHRGPQVIGQAREKGLAFER